MAAGSALIAAGGDIGDMLKSAAIAYGSAAAFEAIGQEFGNLEFFSPRHLAKTLAHGTGGGRPAFQEQLLRENRLTIRRSR